LTLLSRSGTSTKSCSDSLHQVQLHSLGIGLNLVIETITNGFPSSPFHLIETTHSSFSAIVHTTTIKNAFLPHLTMPSGPNFINILLHIHRPPPHSSRPGISSSGRTATGLLTAVALGRLSRRPHLPHLQPGRMLPAHLLRHARVPGRPRRPGPPPWSPCATGHADGQEAGQDHRP